ncbi:DUF58 domain-containing protein [Pseudonocardiaceae bacterium YIM PH 21723]|nr:DUF58 domain-containing protein [Pseudonocardiaceae bacterium YIM PH 21723]
MLSGITTRGRCVLAAGLAAVVCAFLFNERDLLRVAAFAVMLPLLAAVLTARANLGLSASRHINPHRVPVGVRSEVLLEITSSGRLPTGELELDETVPYVLGNQPQLRLNKLGVHRNTVLRYPLEPNTRGVHRVGPLIARVTDPFGLAEYDREIADYSKLIVVPRITPFYGLPHGSGQTTGQDGTARMRAGQGEHDVVVRQYRNGDDMRKVHWRSTARRDELMVRVEERPWQGGCTVLLDSRAGAHRGSGPGASLEWAVSFAASACVHLHRHGQHVRLLTQDGRLLSGRQDSADQDPEMILDALAALQPSHRRDLVFGADPAHGQAMIAVLGATDEVTAEELVRFRSRNGLNMAVLLDVTAWSPGGTPTTQQTAGILTRAGWAVVIAGPNSGMTQLWTVLCRASALTGAGNGDWR